MTLVFHIYEGETFGLVGESEVENQQLVAVSFVYTIQLLVKFFSMEKDISKN